jgi:hypothetical protein
MNVSGGSMLATVESRERSQDATVLPRNPPNRSGNTLSPARYADGGLGSLSGCWAVSNHAVIVLLGGAEAPESGHSSVQMYSGAESAFRASATPSDVPLL